MKDRQLLLASFYTKRTKSFQNTGMIHNFYSLTLLLQTDARWFNICRKGLNGIALSFGRKNHDSEQLIYHLKLCYSSFNPQINFVKQIPKQITLYAIVIRHSGSWLKKPIGPVSNFHTFPSVGCSKFLRGQKTGAYLFYPNGIDVTLLLQSFEHPEPSVVQSVPLAILFANPYRWYLVDNKRMVFASIQSGVNGITIIKLFIDGILAVIDLRWFHGCVTSFFVVFSICILRMSM